MAQLCARAGALYPGTPHGLELGKVKSQGPHLWREVGVGGIGTVHKGPALSSRRPLPSLVLQRRQWGRQRAVVPHLR